MERKRSVHLAGFLAGVVAAILAVLAAASVAAALAAFALVAAADGIHISFHEVQACFRPCHKLRESCEEQRPNII